MSFPYPSTTLKKIREKPRWVIMFLVLASVSIGIGVLIHPYATRMLVSCLPTSVTDHDRIVAVQRLDQELFVRSAFLPIRLLLGWATFALALYYVCVTLLPHNSVRFIHLFSLEVHAEALLVVAKMAALLRMVFVPPIVGSPFIVPLSLAQFVRVHDYSMMSFLNSINFFTLAYLVFLGSGISIICAVRRIKALLVAGMVLAVSSLLNAGILTIMRDQFHLLVD
jgi:hypothetical protein